MRQCRTIDSHLSFSTSSPSWGVSQRYRASRDFAFLKKKTEVTFNSSRGFGRSRRTCVESEQSASKFASFYRHSALECPPQLSEAPIAYALTTLPPPPNARRNKGAKTKHARRNTLLAYMCSAPYHKSGQKTMIPLLNAPSLYTLKRRI